MDVLDDGQEHLLANLLGIFPRELLPELKYESCRCGIVPVEQFIPGAGFTPATAGKQINFGVRAHDGYDSISGRSV
jgi:hypothetical protein